MRKIIFYILWSLSVVQLSFYLFMPFGGISTIVLVINNGLYNVDNHLIRPEWRNVFLKVNQFLAVLNFTSLTLSILIPVLSKNKGVNKYIWSIFFSLIALVLLLAGLFSRLF